MICNISHVIIRLHRNSGTGADVDYPNLGIILNGLKKQIEEELQTIQTMAKTLLMLPNDKRPYHPLSEDYLFERVDAGIASADEGNYRPSEEMEADLKKKYNLK